MSLSSNLHYVEVSEQEIAHTNKLWNLVVQSKIAVYV